MAGYNPINVGNQPNDGLGDGGRTGAQKINSMFQEVFYQKFIYTDGNGNKHKVERTSFNAATVNPTALQEDDIVSGWEDENKERWVKGIVLDDTVVIPDDYDVTAKFLKIEDVLKI